MGHIHLSKLKFRHPVPDVFSPNKSVSTEQPRKDMDPSTCTPLDSEVNFFPDDFEQIYQYSCFWLAFLEFE